MQLGESLRRRNKIFPFHCMKHSQPIQIWMGLCFDANIGASAKINKCRVLRDVIPPTPPGPEGSNGNGLVRAQ